MNVNTFPLEAWLFYGYIPSFSVCFFPKRQVCTAITLQVLMALVGKGPSAAALLKAGMSWSTEEVPSQQKEQPLGIKTSCRQGPNEDIRLLVQSRDKSCRFGWKRSTNPPKMGQSMASQHTTELVGALHEPEVEDSENAPFQVPCILSLLSKSCNAGLWATR